MDPLEKLSGKTVAVIGTGYIGSRLSASLAVAGDFEVVSIGRQDIDRLWARPFDHVFNCAGNTGDFRRFPLETVDSNIGLTSFLLKNCNIAGSLVCLSSTRIYGFTADENKVFGESDAGENRHRDADALYDDTKRLMESMLLHTPRPYRKIAVRLSNVYGRFTTDDLDDSTFLKVMLRAKHDAQTLEVKQPLRSSKDYVHIDDALDGIVRAGILSEGDDVYNIASGRSYSVDDWARFLGLTAKALSDAPPQYSRISVAKAREKLQFTPSKFLDELSVNDIITYE